MITLCKIDDDGRFLDETLQVEPTAACPPGWVRSQAPDPPPPGQVCVWNSDGWILITPAAPDLAAIRTAAIAEIGAQRWAATQAFMYDGVLAPADKALSAVVGTLVGAQISPPVGPIAWELAPGEFRAWTITQIQDYGIAIRGHIQACFDQARDVVAAIKAAETMGEIEQAIASVSWPS